VVAALPFKSRKPGITTAGSYNCTDRSNQQKIIQGNISSRVLPRLTAHDREWLRPLFCVKLEGGEFGLLRRADAPLMRRLFQERISLYIISISF